MYVVPRRSARTVIKQFPITIVITILLAGCASAPSTTTTSIAWDGLGRDPKLTLVKRHAQRVAFATRRDSPNVDREKVLATLRPYSDAWWIVHDEIDAENDRQLNSKLLICRGCLARDNDVTGSVP